MDIISVIAKEVTKDKYLTLFLIIVLLAAFIKTSDRAIEQLLVTAVGGFLGLTRNSQQQQQQQQQEQPNYKYKGE